MFNFKNKKISAITFLLLFFVSIFFVFDFSFAQSATNTFGEGIDVVDQNIALGSTDIRIIIMRIVNVFLSLLGIITVGIIAYGGFLWMTAGGNEDQVSKAKKFILNGVIGLAIVLSSWAITRFVFSRLGWATGFRETEITIKDPRDPSLGFCESYPALCCYEDNFVVKSITPNTVSSNDQIAMHNVVIRVVFSQKINNSYSADEVFNVLSVSNQKLNDKFSFNFKENKTVVEAVPNDDFALCDNVDDKEIFCLDPDSFNVQVNKIRDENGNEIETETDCGIFPKEASFSLSSLLQNNYILDEEPLEIDFKINNKNSNISLARNSFAEFSVSLDDDKSNSYYVLKTYPKENEDSAVIRYVDGPAVSNNSSLKFDSIYSFRPSSFAYNTIYVAKVIAYDSDHNVSSSSLEFRVAPDYCFDSDPSNDDLNCGSGEGLACRYTSDCNSNLHLKCINETTNIECSGENDCVCTRWPYIEEVEKMNGAVGNWVTIAGYNFGDDQGEVYFGDVKASFAQCASNPVWNKNWIIAEVPSQTSATSTLIRVKTIDDKNESTVDNFGPILGLFSYNDVKRPGLCSVKNLADNSDSALPNSMVNLIGKAFGVSSGEVFFGNRKSGVNTWGDTSINSFVPFTEEGQYSVFVKSSSGEDSNPVPFNILKTEEDYNPFIESIDPATNTPKSYITIRGKNFGFVKGRVEMVLNNGYQFSADDLPQECGNNTWTDTQIIIKVPESAASFPDPITSSTIVNVKIIRGSDSLESNQKTIETSVGIPNPSICNIIPNLEKNLGVAPLFSPDYIQIIGENLNVVLDDPAHADVYFWNVHSSSTVLSTWLKRTLAAQQTICGVGSTEVCKTNTIIPYDSTNGLSMSTGPIKMKVNNKISNSFTYNINSCLNPNYVLPSGFKCCAEGPEAGLVKPSSFACEGENREAGYVWRMTTGKIPKVFQVIEKCDKNIAFSPTPWNGWKSKPGAKVDICKNAQIQVKFSLAVDESTVKIASTEDLNTQNINIYKCEFLNGEKICPENISSVFKILVFSSDTIILRKKDNSDLDANTEYRVVLSKNIQSQETVEEFGVNKILNENLKSTRPLESISDSAYHFDFKTSNRECLLTGAGINRPSFTTYLLGIVQDDRYAKIYDLDRIFSKTDPNMHPLYYNVYGLGDEACVVLNVSGEDWDWGPKDNVSNPATSERSDAEVTDIAIAKAWENAPAGAEIFARVTTTIETENESGQPVNVLQEVRATSTLYIDLGNPEVLERWPNCIEACVNTEIGARFNMVMASTTYDDNFEIYKCSNESCSDIPDDVNNTLTSISANYSPASNENNLKFYSSIYLEPATWYLVKLIATSTSFTPISAISSIRQGVVTIGKNLTSNNNDGNYVWKFRTKDSPEPCTLDSISVLPSPYISTYIGQRTRYTVACRAAPDSCSPYGQFLNPWNFGWLWGTANSDIASITNFSFSGKTNPFCNYSCLPTGSDISFERYDSKLNFYCGNGVVDPGEDCDIAGNISEGNPEIPGISCGFDCLRPGNKQTSCGNGVVEPHLGEECDRGASLNGAEGSTCSSICLNTGSSRVETGDVDISLCGSGGVTAGEDCDIAIPFNKNSPSNTQNYSCSNNCLHLGTPLSQAWCDTYYVAVGEGGTYNFDFSSLNSSVRNLAQNACKKAVSVCGNNIIESGEECDCFDQENCSDYCSNRCLIKNNICGRSGEQCGSTFEGCASDCSFAGSSLDYFTPSVCGDGVVGIGENPKCEIPILEAQNSLGQNPIQLVTAIGNVAEIKNFMTTTIHVTSTNVAIFDADQNMTVSPTNPITGQGDYTLQCGFFENEKGLNNCPLNLSPSNNFGVASNSCCMSRPFRVGQYPYVNSPDACPNTLIQVSFNKKINQSSIKVNENIYIVEGYEDGRECVGENVSIAMNDYLNIKSKGFFAKIWYKIKSFFAKVFLLDDAYAGVEDSYFYSAVQNNTLTGLSADVTWCKVNKIRTVNFFNESEDYNTTSTLNISLSDILAKDAHIFIMMQGNKNDLKDEMGVAIKNPFSDSLLDSWYFKTQKEICKIASIEIDPSSHIFRRPNESKLFEARAVTDKKQVIAPIVGVYDWLWSWKPVDNPIFNIPGENIDRLFITSKGVEGQITGVLNADVITDEVGGTQEGLTFTKLFNLTAFFCSNIWPVDGNVTFIITEEDGTSDHLNTENKFTDNYFNFSMLYCADAGNPLTKIDDLPRFDRVRIISSQVELGGGYCKNNPSVSCSNSSDCEGKECIINALTRYIFFSNKTSDVIGLQIFRNEAKSDGSIKNLEGWYLEKLNALDLGNMQEIEIASYPALTDGKNYYVNALNLGESANTVYNNVYLFSINDGASKETTEVFEKIINSLEFNINITNHNRCLESDGDLRSLDLSLRNKITEYDCTTDFDCRDNTGVPKPGTSGFCSNEKTKLNRDLLRLNDLKKVQNSLDTYFSQASFNDFKADLQSGSYINNYSNSRWSSWGYLGSMIGGIIKDPINEWRGCEGYDAMTCWNPASSTFKCPYFSQIYEYEFTSSSPRTYKFYAPLEFFRSSDSSFLNQFINLNKIKVDERFCEIATGDTYNPFIGVCGDGIVNKNAGEECELGQEKIVRSYYSGATFVSCDFPEYSLATCSADCKWNYSSCQSYSATGSCGDGIVQTGEVCDDGIKNGKYGSKCSSDCKTILSDTDAMYCGNNRLDYIDVNEDGKYNFGDILLERCDTVDSVCNYFSEITGVIKSASEQKPRVHILLDNSGSMKSVISIFGPSRWSSSVDAIKEIFDEKKDSVNFSLSVFGIPSNENGRNYCLDKFSRSCLLHNSSSTLDLLYINYFISGLEKISPATDTPTGEAIEDIYNDIKDAKKVFTELDLENLPIIFLITDGNPNTTNNSLNLATSTLEKLFLEYGIKTFALGFDDVSTINMNNFAKFGGTVTPYYISSAQSIINIFNQILACNNYSSVSKYHSCSYDCQSFGEYCGDGIIQWSEGETCDDGNKINNDSCFNTCIINPGYVGVCGNNIIDKSNGEECDLGASNGQAGQVCTNQCKIVDGSQNICGNGIIEPLNNEQCDLGSSNGVLCPNTYGQCYYCSEKCEVLVRDKA